MRLGQFPRFIDSSKWCLGLTKVNGSQWQTRSQQPGIQNVFLSSTPRHHFINPQQQASDPEKNMQKVDGMRPNAHAYLQNVDSYQVGVLVTGKHKALGAHHESQIDTADQNLALLAEELTVCSPNLRYLRRHLVIKLPKRRTLQSSLKEFMYC